MIKTIPVVYRSGVFVPLKAVNEFAEETPLEIEVYLPLHKEDESQDDTEYSLEQTMALLHQTSGLLHSDLPVSEVRYIVESSQLAEENIWLDMEPTQ